MKKKFKIFKFLTIIFLSIFAITNSYSEEKASESKEIYDQRYACNLYYEKIKNNKDSRARNFHGYWVYDDFGFLLKETLDKDKNKWVAEIDEDGYAKVGKIYSHITASKIKPEHTIISINNVKINDSNQFIDLILDENLQKLNIDLIDEKNKKYSVTIKKHQQDYGELDYSLREIFITDIDIKKSNYTVTINDVHEFEFNDRSSTSEEKHILHKLSKDILVYYHGIDQRWTFHVCDPGDSLFDDLILQNPSDTKILNVLRADKDLEVRKNIIFAFDERLGNNDNYIVFQRSKTSVLQIKNDFNLKSFPFDRQKLIFRIVDQGFYLHSRIIHNQSFSFEAIDRFMKLDDIPGWKKVGVKVFNFLHQNIAQEEGTYYDGVGFEITLERKHGYYIYKVILPIILILMVCWSVVWVDPKELESRLTITIVCLLSLIAYNFVIDSELPKLEYLTVLDWIILISYVYATVPNFLSVISFRLQKTNLALSNRLEYISRRYGISTYVLSIFIIIWINAASNPDNSSTLISWMGGR